MRNLVSSVLPPGGHVDIKLDPPLDVRHERPYVMTVRGRDTAVVDSSNPSVIVVVNPTTKIAPIVFFIGPVEPRSVFRQVFAHLLTKR